ncbi:hypothetical protein EVAR_39268_1 [Eumeta japonica]|uniref:Uncharacterized protein n=1 Tax=Eumeta variegata TaxID=151549 RepID=A0A4C1VWL7_EUMVA|nr:hypothetical protein EVAR_39268_1 [Eumeta japonica]
MRECAKQIALCSEPGKLLFGVMVSARLTRFVQWECVWCAWLATPAQAVMSGALCRCSCRRKEVFLSARLEGTKKRCTRILNYFLLPLVQMCGVTMVNRFNIIGSGSSKLSNPFGNVFRECRCVEIPGYLELPIGRYVLQLFFVLYLIQPRHFFTLLSKGSSLNNISAERRETVRAEDDCPKNIRITSFVNTCTYTPRFPSTRNKRLDRLLIPVRSFEIACLGSFLEYRTTTSLSRRVWIRLAIEAFITSVEPYPSDVLTSALVVTSHVRVSALTTFGAVPYAAFPLMLIELDGSALLLARSAQAERDNESCGFSCVQPAFIDL